MATTNTKNIMDYVNDFIIQAGEEDMDTDTMLEAWNKKEKDIEELIDATKLKSLPKKQQKVSLSDAKKDIEELIDATKLKKSLPKKQQKVSLSDAKEDSVGSGATYRDSDRNWLYRKFNDNETVVVVMDSPSLAGIKKNDQTTTRLNKIIHHNDYGSYHLINISIKGWEKDLVELSKLTDKIVIGWGAVRRDKKETQNWRIMIQDHYTHIYQFQAKGKENMPTRLKYETLVVPLEW
jgi:hypothetical protein